MILDKIEINTLDLCNSVGGIYNAVEILKEILKNSKSCYMNHFLLDKKIKDRIYNIEHKKIIDSVYYKEEGDDEGIDTKMACFSYGFVKYKRPNQSFIFMEVDDKYLPDNLRNIYLEKERKKEEVRNKMMDVDPYGEEEWLEESVKLDKEIRIIYLDDLYKKYRDRIHKLDLIAHELKKEIGNYIKLKTYFGKGITGLHTLIYNEYLLLKNVTVKDYETEKEYNRMLFIEIDKIGNIPVIESLVLLVKEPLRIITPEDPYGEEDWNEKMITKFDKFLNESIDDEEINIGDTVIMVNPYDALYHGLYHMKGFHKSNNGPNFKFLVTDKRFFGGEECITGTDYDHGGSVDLWYKSSCFKKIKPKEFNRRFTEEDPYGEEDWTDDVNESYYPDLSPFEYSWEMPECVNVGWLDENHPFEKGEVPEGFVEKLSRMPRFAQHCGYHECHFCENQTRETRSSSIKLAIGDGVVYLFPELTIHYISKHNYKPPQEFIDAVLKMENMTEGEARRYMNNLMLRHKEHFDKMLGRKK